MPRGKSSDTQNIALDLVDACSREIGRDAAVKGIRNVCRYFGGGMYYFPKKKKDGPFINELRGTLREAVGGSHADIIVDKMMSLLGTFQIYIPLEHTAFEDAIAEEIYRRNTEENTGMNKMFRDYNISFTKVYRLWRKGRRIKLNKEKKK